MVTLALGKSGKLKEIFPPSAFLDLLLALVFSNRLMLLAGNALRM